MKQREFLENQISSRPPRTYWQIVRRQFFKNRMATVGLYLVIFLFFVAIYAPFLANDKPFLVHMYPVNEYKKSWNGLFGLYSDVFSKLKKKHEEKARLERVQKLEKEYFQVKKNQITVDEICRRLEKGESEEKLKEEVPKRRAKPFRLTEADRERLEEAGASEEFIHFLETAPTRFDHLTVQDLLALIRKKTPLEEIRKEVRRKRVNPFFIEPGSELEMELQEAFEEAYQDKYKDPLKREEAFQEFLNFLSEYRLDVEKEIQKLKRVKEKSTVSPLPLDQYESLFTQRIQELKSYLKEEKQKQLETLLNRYKALLEQVRKNQFPSEKQFKELENLLAELKFSKEKKGVQHRDLVMVNFYPIIYQLGAFDIFFMVLFPLVFLSFLPFRWIDRLKIDSFVKFFLKAAFLFFIPAAAALVWWIKVPYRQDRNDYRRIIPQFIEGEYAYIQPFFYSPYWMNDEESFQPPSWLMPEYIGLESKAEGGKVGKVIYETFEVPPRFRSDLPVGMQIRSEYLRLKQEEYRKLERRLAAKIYEKLKDFIETRHLRPFLTERYTIRPELQESRNIQEDLQEIFRVPQKEVPQVLRAIREYEKLYVFYKKKFLQEKEFSNWQKLEKYLSSIKVVTDLTEYKKVLRYEIPEDQVVFSNLKEKKLVLKRSLRLMPGAVLILPADVKLVFEYQPPGFYWTDTDARKLYNYHIFGTDKLGRDVFARMVWGARISLTVGFVAVSIYVFIGILLGSLAGYFGGMVDIVISRFIEVMICFPTLVLILTLIASLPRWVTQIWNGMFAIMVVIGITGWTGVARLIRGEFLKLRNQDFVTAGRALGVSNLRLIFRHIVPNALAPVLVSATFGVASAILTESGLSFLGLGVSPPTPTWGEMLSKAQGQPLELWWLTFFPGFAIFFTVTIYNLVGEGIRDAIDPRLKER